MPLDYKVYVQDPKWELLAAFYCLEDSVKYILGKQEKDKRKFKVMSRNRNIRVFEV